MDKWVDTAFGNLINSYLAETDGLTYEEVEQALREQAKRWGGCLGCRYSVCGINRGMRFSAGQNKWTTRKCQVGLHQDNCGMWKAFPEEVERI